MNDFCYQAQEISSTNFKIDGMIFPKAILVGYWNIFTSKVIRQTIIQNSFYDFQTNKHYRNRSIVTIQLLYTNNLAIIRQQKRPAQKQAYGEMLYALTLEMKYT